MEIRDATQRVPPGWDQTRFQRGEVVDGRDPLPRVPDRDVRLVY
jgi:hypothetical protein